VIPVRTLSLLLTALVVAAPRPREEELRLLLKAEDLPVPPLPRDVVAVGVDPGRCGPVSGLRAAGVPAVLPRSDGPSGRGMFADIGDPQTLLPHSRAEWLLASYPRAVADDSSRGYKGKRKPTRRERREANRRSR
jgi:hypothetical protein